MEIKRRGSEGMVDWTGFLIKVASKRALIEVYNGGNRVT